MFINLVHASSFRGWSSPSHPCLIFMIILKLPDENHLPGYTSNACSAGRRILQFLLWRIWSPALSVKWGALAQVSILKSKVIISSERKHILQISANISLCPKMAPCFLGRKSCSLITMNQMEPSTLYDLVIHSSSLFLHHDHDCQGALFVHFIIAKARTKLTGWQRAT